MTWELLSLLLTTFVATVDGRENGLFDFHRQCVSRGQATMGCPDHHMVAVSSATYYKSKGSSCNTQEGDRCIVKEDHLDTFFKCYEQTVCVLSLVEPNPVPAACDGYQGETYIEIKYKCEPRLTGPRGELMTMCANLTFTGSVVFLRNKGFPSPSSESECSCDIQIAKETYIQFTIFQFEDTLQPHIPVNYCPQTLHFWTDHQSGTEHTVCSHDEDVNKPMNISVDSRAVVNLEASRTFMMILIVQVYHEDDLTITCIDKSTLKSKEVTTTAPPTTTIVTPEAVMETSTEVLTTATATTATTALGPEAKANTTKTEGSSSIIPIVVSVVVILLVIIVLLIIGVIYLRHTRQRERREARKEQTERFAFENVLYDTRTDNATNGTGHMANGTSTMVIGNGITSSQNEITPYSSPLGGARGDRKYSSIRNQASGGNKEIDEKVHIYDHHESRPVEWPPKPPPGHRLSFRESKGAKEQESPYEELPGPDYQTLPGMKGLVDESASAKIDNTINKSNEGTSEGSDNGKRGWRTVEPQPPPLPSTDSRPNLQSSFAALNPRMSVSLHSGIDGDNSMTNITQSTT